MIFGVSKLISAFICCAAVYAQDTVNSVQLRGSDTLRLVNVLYRHGDRGPVTFYPNDPHKANASEDWPQGLGWLTETGMRQQYALGQFLRSEYMTPDNFLNTTYNHTEIKVQASNEDRCLMSAYCNLAGLYPPVKSQQWNDKLLWQPIPVHTVPEREDNKLALGRPCARYDQLYAKELRGPQVQEEEKVNAAFYQFIDNATGVKRENISEVWKVADTLLVEKTHNLSLPNWTQEKWKTGTMYSKLMDLKDWSFGLLYNGTILSRLKGGPLLKEFIQNMQYAVSDTAGHSYKMHMYSAHDITIAAVLNAMMMYNQRAPPYASAVLVELHDVDGEYCVKVRFRNSTTAPPHILHHQECQQDCCPLDKFVEVTKDRVPDDWEAECGNSETVSSSDSLLTGTIVAFAVLVVVLLLIMFILCISYLRQRQVIRTFEII